ncbi:uncharacterized protein LOC131243818 [Magnolia sinica]|uniref:uncharacterized protein LOC131243818 n=1 Tax=Magnolia sinica TaxID=86752 RepID=UPI002659FB56|nr:uncharacterized protein LOC131243818 [Magnolia sinica]
MVLEASLEVNHFRSITQKLRAFYENFGECFCKLLGVTSLVFYFLFIFLSNNPFGPQSSSLILKRHPTSCNTHNHTPSINTTNLTHIVFGVAGSIKTWRNRGPYVDLWWRPNRTRGFVWLDRAPDYPWPSSSPPFRISEDISRFHDYAKHAMPFAIRMVRVVLESFRADMDNVRWYVMVDDDTVLVLDNLVEVLAKYDHNKYFYIGGNSECISQNTDHSFEMAFGGAAYAMSFPLVKALARILDDCLKRYQTLYGSDHIIQSCIAEIGVSLTREPGFHQIDLHGDISGLLSAHPQSPFLSLHHIDFVDPIFPSMDRLQSLKHIMEPASTDSSRLLQQTICYDKRFNWSLSISWGYSAQIYEKIHPPSILQRPLQTFWPWKNSARPPFMFNVRPLSRDPCEAAHFFFFKSVDVASDGRTITNYIRRSARQIPACDLSGNYSADGVSTIRVFSPATKLQGVGRRRECCEVIPSSDANVTEVTVRACMDNELVG